MTTQEGGSSTEADTIEVSRERFEQMVERVNTLEEQRDRIQDLEQTVEEQNERINELEQAAEEREKRLEVMSRRDAKLKRALGELQTRELNKAAHLQKENIIYDEVGVTTETIVKDDGQNYVRVPGAEDSIEHGGGVSMAQEDLLPIQQLARMDDDMLANETRGVQIAVRAWRERKQDQHGLWQQGSQNVDEYFNASDLRRFIERTETGVSKDYAKKLTTRAIEALRDLANYRLPVKKKSRRKDGLSYKERRVILPADVEIPGETPPSPADTDDAPETDVVHG